MVHNRLGLIKQERKFDIVTSMIVMIVGAKMGEY